LRCSEVVAFWVGGLLNGGMKMPNRILFKETPRSSTVAPMAVPVRSASIPDHDAAHPARSRGSGADSRVALGSPVRRFGGLPPWDCPATL
jgi:hypothetical protein